MLRSAPFAVQRFVVASVVLMAVGALGCSDRACFRVSRATASCPSAVNAKDRFGDCSNIESIDSDGALVAGNLCCYDVTHSLDGIPGPGPCPGIGGGNSRSSSGDVSPGSQVATSSGIGGMGGMHTTSTGTGTGAAGGAANGGGGFGGSPTCETLPCGFTKEQPLSGCLSCTESTLCKMQSDACDTECHEFESCIGACDITDSSCILGCRTMFANGALLFDAFLQCAACSVCATSCASSAVMTLAMCGGSGGAGGATGAGGMGGAGGVGGTPTP